jgi:predicted transcriptional regulator YheO
MSSKDASDHDPRQGTKATPTELAGQGKRRASPGPDVAAEDAVIDALRSLVPALSGIFGRNCEVVVHDLRRPERSIVAIANSHVTGRTLHGPLVGGPFGDVSLKWLRDKGVGNKTQVYETRTRDGRTLKSATTLFRGDRGEPFAALCLNHDIQLAELALSFLSELVNTNGPRVMPAAEEPSTPPDVDDILSQLIADALKGHRKPPLSKEERIIFVRDLDDKGAFLVKGAVKKVAEAMGVSKFTIYGDLDRARKD